MEADVSKPQHGKAFPTRGMCQIIGVKIDSISMLLETF